MKYVLRAAKTRNLWPNAGLRFDVHSLALKLKAISQPKLLLL